MHMITTLAAVTAMTMPLAAQQERHQADHAAPRMPAAAMQDHDGMGMPLMREVHAFRPAALLERGAILGLSPQQVERLTALGAESDAVHEQARRAVQEGLEQARAAWAAGDMPTATRATRASFEAMQTAHLGALTSAGAARALLTPEQRGRVQGWLEAGRGHRSEMGHRQDAQRHQLRQSRAPRQRRSPTRN